MSLKVLLTVLMMLISSIHLTAESGSLVIVMPAHNAEKYVKPAIQSLANQDFKDFELIFVDDGSKDKTLKRLKMRLKMHKLEARSKILTNEQKSGPIASLAKAIKKMPKNKVVVVLDADDELANQKALAHVAKLFRDDKVWLAYGTQMGPLEHSQSGWKDFPAHKFSDKTIRNRHVRNLPWISYRFKAFRAGLFQAIQKPHLSWEGKTIKVALDAAYMLPMIEMASHGHVVFTDQPIVNYHGEHSRKDWRTSSDLQQTIFEELSRIAPYAPLNQLK